MFGVEPNSRAITVLSGNLQVEHHSRVSRHQGGQRGGLWSSPAPTLHIPRMSMHRSLLHNWLKGLVNPPIPVTYIELSTEHRYIMTHESWSR